MKDFFLNDQELKELTGIKQAKDGIPRYDLQADHLRRIGVPFYPNARGRPMVVRDVLIGNTKQAKEKPKWKPKPLR